MTAEQPFPTPPGEQSGNAIDAIRAAIRIDMINWQSPDLERYDVGGYSVVYRIVPGLIAKVGFIEEEEVTAQNYFARLDKAVPVIDYQAEVETSAEVRTAVCSEHGIRPVVANVCTCNSLVAVSLMPEATLLPTDPTLIGISKTQVEQFMEEVSTLCEREFGFQWDDRLTCNSSYTFAPIVVKACR